MRHGETRLADECRYLVRRPDEIFLRKAVLSPSDVDDPVWQFLMGKTDELAPFELPVARKIEGGWMALDDAARPLNCLAFAVRPFKYSSDPRLLAWQRLRLQWNTGNPDDPVEGTTKDLWDMLSSIFNNNRVSEGLIAGSLTTVTRIANEIRRRLLAARNPDATREELLKATVLVAHRPKKDPRDLKILDPACGSAHFLLYSFTLLRTIYEEAYDDRDLGPKLKGEYPTAEAFRQAIPGLILRHNLHGIDIDPRAVQIAGLALWLRCQRAYQEIGLKKDRPPILKTNVVCAEPMPGEAGMLAEFVAQLEPRVLGQLVEVVFDRMKLAGEAGSLLKVEEEIAGVVAAAKSEWSAGPVAVQKTLFADLGPSTRQRQFEFSDMTDDQFFDRAEETIVEALRRYAAQARDGQALHRRLFAEDAARGLGFVDVCRQRFDVALMNPPFGEGSKLAKGCIEKQYPRTKNDLYAAFVEMGLRRLHPGGLLGAITSRTGFFLSSFQKWREEILLREAKPTVFADLGYGVLDTAMVETAAYCLVKCHETV